MSITISCMSSFLWQLRQHINLQWIIHNLQIIIVCITSYSIWIYSWCKEGTEDNSHVLWIWEEKSLSWCRDGKSSDGIKCYLGLRRASIASLCVSSSWQSTLKSVKYMVMFVWSLLMVKISIRTVFELFVVKETRKTGFNLWGQYYGSLSNTALHRCAVHPSVA